MLARLCPPPASSAFVFDSQFPLKHSRERAEERRTVGGMFLSLEAFSTPREGLFGKFFTL
jgi:hypothetical protein